MLSKRGDGGESGASRRFAPPENGGGVGGSGGGGDGDRNDRKKPPPPQSDLIELIEKAATRVAHHFGFSPEDTEDFCQAAQVHLLEEPGILAKYRGVDPAGNDPTGNDPAGNDPAGTGPEGRVGGTDAASSEIGRTDAGRTDAGRNGAGRIDSCSLLGYLIGVLRNYALDIYRRRVGKWHASANAKRLGREAELLEALRYRDHRDAETAFTKVLEKFPQLTRRRVLELDELLKPRGLREWLGDAPLERLPALSHADEGVEAHELEAIQGRVQRVLREVLDELPVADRVMVKAIFGKGQSIKDFALFQGVRQRQMYSHFERLRLTLRRRLEGEGISAEDALRIIGWSDSALNLDLDSDSEIPDDGGAESGGRRSGGGDVDDPDRPPDA